MAVTIEIPGVERRATRLPLISVGESIHRLSTVAQVRSQTQHLHPPFVPFEGVSEPDAEVHAPGMHGLVGAVHLAFDQHLPLRLSPDHIWITLAQGLAAHVNLDPERVRSRLVPHQGRETIEVQRNDFVKGKPDNPWPEVIEDFSSQLRERIGKRHDLLVSEFSTTGPMERFVSQVVLMDTVKSFYEYKFYTLCGIPQITLEGHASDWYSVRDRARALREFDLSWWVDALMPVLDGLVAAAEGTIDVDFWRSMYKLEQMSGGPYVTGWIQTLFPYVEGYVETDDAPQRALKRNGYIANWHSEHGPKTTDFPSGLSSVPFQWQYLDQRLEMSLLGGFVGLTQDYASGTLTPKLGWAVRELG